ncbi:MAG TPA: hypothetical protein VHB79_05655 [Polyangiaceae bacterium]|nr:hypothetical protein [Polyangiaceae bacterium]
MPVASGRTRPSASPVWLLSLPLSLALAAFGCTVDSNGGDGGAGSAAGGSASTAGQAPTAGSGGSTVLPGGGSSSQPTAGTAATTGGTGVITTGGTASTTAGSNAGGSAPAGGTGSGGSSVVDNGMDTPPTHPLVVDPQAASNKQWTFTAKQLDPMAGTSSTDTNAGSQEHAFVDFRKPKVQGKLVLTLGGIGTCCGQGGIGGFAQGLGFHEMAIAYQTKISSAPDKYKDALKANPMDPEANRQMGDARMEAFDGKDRVDWLDINEHDSFAYRTEVALKYMQQQDPGSQWDYFLTADGHVRWSDVYFVGYSYGSQTLAVWGKYVRIGRGIATSGPVNEGFPNATWIKAVSATPLDRMIGMYGSENLDNKVQTASDAGWLVPVVTVNAGATTADLMGGHQFILQGQGHSEFCAGDGGNWKALCQYAFGVMQ